MGNITLSEAWPVISGVALLLIGIIAFFIRRIDDENRREHERQNEATHGKISSLAEHNERQHAELFGRVRDLEIDYAAMKAQHDKNH